MIRRVVSAIAALIISAVATLAAYMAFLGWDHKKVLGPDGNLHGPYEAWQVVGFSAVMALIAAAVGWVSRSLAGAIGCTVMLTVGASIDASNDVENDGLWPLGVTFLAIGTFTVLLAITYIAARESRRRDNVQGTL